MVDSKSALRITLEQLPVNDYIGFRGQPELMKLISGEQLLFADKIQKTNMFEWTQERTFVITNAAVYNIHKKEIKRSIKISEIGGLSKTVPPSKVLEFSIHVPATYDYRFTSARRDDIVMLLKQLYLIEFKQNCPVYHITAKNLKDFTTTEKDFKKALSRIPTQEYRSFDEDLITMDTPLIKGESVDEQGFQP
jgi:hypothetical protein